MRKNITTVSIAILTFLIFSLLYFQYNTSNLWRLKPKKAKPISVIFPQPYEIHKPNLESEKYLSYLPHSGFHNQRIELENALLLAAYLNRTLLVPPVFLANPAMPWLRYERLYERVLLQTKVGLDHCPHFALDMPLPEECLNSFRWTTVPWSFFYNMSKIQDEVVPIIFKENLSYEWIFQSFNLNSDDVYFFKDMSPYEYQIHDDPSLNLPLDRFNSRIDLGTLEKIEHKLLHFGSMFGSYRVLAEREAHREMLRTIRTGMIFKNKVLTTAAENIVNQLGGANQFVGMHIRVGDGIFKLRASILVDDIFHELVDKYTDLTVEQVAEYEGGVEQHKQDRTEIAEYEIKLRTSHPIDVSDHNKPIEVHHSIHEEPFFGTEPNIAKRLKCQPGDNVTRRFRNTVVYIATDAPDPRNHPLLRKLFTVFPCSFILSDFMEELEDIKRLEVVEERVKLDPYLIPMIDAMISAHAHTFLGTPHSTFTSYIERQLHPVYTNKEVQVMGLEEYLESMAPKK
ncbi:CigA protein [Pilobolus umbonatus]|nr:CigA protein [Pilobolus umbonatus]